MSEAPEKIWLKFNNKGTVIDQSPIPLSPDLRWHGYVHAPEEPKKERYQVRESPEFWDVLDERYALFARFSKRVPNAES